jgi:hypothetical protein
VKGDPLRLWRVEKNRFFADWRVYNLSRMEEWANIETSHRAFIEGKWHGVKYFEHWTGEEKDFF